MAFDLEARLAQRRAEDLYRQRPTLQSPQGPEVVVDGQPLTAFCSNDYLGLANHPEVVEAWCTSSACPSPASGWMPRRANNCMSRSACGLPVVSSFSP